MTDEERTKALRLARAIASDISLYNEQKIIKGIEQARDKKIDRPWRKHGNIPV